MSVRARLYESFGSCNIYLRFVCRHRLSAPHSLRELWLWVMRHEGATKWNAFEWIFEPFCCRFDLNGLESSPVQSTSYTQFWLKVLQKAKNTQTICTRTKICRMTGSESICFCDYYYCNSCTMNAVGVRCHFPFHKLLATGYCISPQNQTKKKRKENKTCCVTIFILSCERDTGRAYKNINKNIYRHTRTTLTVTKYYSYWPFGICTMHESTA